MRRVFLVAILSLLPLLVAAIHPDDLTSRPAIASKGAETAPMSMKSEWKSAQTAAGYNCRTAAGICPIDPAPLGAPCRCGDYMGVVVP